MATLTPEEISQILEQFFQTVGTRQYIGARYIPIFGRRGETSIQWDNSAPYEPLTIVQYQGNSYTSRQFVPAGVDINNQTYWASTGVYNSQVEQYRQEVLTFDNRITANADAITQLDGDLDNAVTQLDGRITANAGAITQLDGRVTANTNAIAAATARSVLLFGDSWTDANMDLPNWKPVAFKDMHYDHVYNYAISGAGWVQGATTNIVQQVANANAELTQEQKDSVVDIIAFALVNDLKHLNSYEAFNAQVNPILSAMQSVYNTLSSQYPRARIFFVPTVCGEGYTNSLAFGNMAIFNKRMANGSANGWKVPYCADFFNTYLQWNDSVLYNEGNLHLTSNGANVIAAAMNKILKGIPIPGDMQIDTTVNASNGALTINLQMAGCNARLANKFTPSAKLEKGDSMAFHLPSGTALHKSIVAAFCRRYDYGFGNGFTNGVYSGNGTMYGAQLMYSNNNTDIVVSVNVTHDNGINASANVYGLI